MPDWGKDWGPGESACTFASMMFLSKNNTKRSGLKLFKIRAAPLSFVWVKNCTMGDIERRICPYCKPQGSDLGMKNARK